MTQKALDKAETILTKDPFTFTEDNDRFGPVLRAQTSVITSVLNTQAKVDETRLRRAAHDRLPELLKLINETAKRLPGAGTILDQDPQPMSPAPT